MSDFIEETSSYPYDQIADIKLPAPKTTPSTLDDLLEQLENSIFDATDHLERTPTSLSIKYDQPQLEIALSEAKTAIINLMLSNVEEALQKLVRANPTDWTHDPQSWIDKELSDFRQNITNLIGKEGSDEG